MTVDSPAGITFAAVLLHAAAVICGFPAALKLERMIPASHKLELSQLKARDATRHGRLLQSPTDGVVDFPVKGVFDPLLVGLYYTKVKLGTPSREFNVQIDTGSDVLWVSCASCNGCPQTSQLEIQLSFFDPGASSSASLVSCSDRRCKSNIQSGSSCSQNNPCSYAFQYGDGSGTSGYYVSDFLSFDRVVTSTLNVDSSAPVVFGCSDKQTGDLKRSNRAVDGIFGLGQKGLSVTSQLASQGLTPQVFSHCLKGDNGGGGILVLGRIERPDTVYTPLVPSHHQRGNVFDTGTTLSYLPEEAYDPFVQAVTRAVSQFGHPILHNGYQCYDIISSSMEMFPQVSFNFAGGASMVLKPRDYLQHVTETGTPMWCIGFQSLLGHQITILGDLVLKDKVVVYDLANQRIGWAEYDCSLEVNVAAVSGRRNSDLKDKRQWRKNSCESNFQCYSLLYSLLPFLHILLYSTLHLS